MKEAAEGMTKEHGLQITSKGPSTQAKLDTEVAEEAKITPKTNRRPHSNNRAKTFHRLADESTAQIS